MRYIDLFAGIGGFAIALNKLGHECVYTNEWNKYAAKVIEQQLKHKVDSRSITDVSPNDIPDHDILCGGFPCQAFSIAGKRRGFDETRGTLFFDIARILKARRPRYFILENVKGLLSHDNGRTFKVIISTIAELGYDCQWQVLNSKDFGVPQNRERVYIVGHIRGEPRPEVFPIGARNTNHIKEITSQVPQAQRVYDDTGISPTLDIAAGGNRQPKVISKTVRSGGLKSPHGSKQNWDSYLVDGRIRRLTPKECERLQGFPDDWTKIEGNSDTQRYKQLGNAVTVNVILEVAKRL